MNFQPDSELHKRRGGRNLAVAICLVALMAILVTLSLVKLTQTGPTEGWDHAPSTARELQAEQNQ